LASAPRIFHFAWLLVAPARHDIVGGVSSTDKGNFSAEIGQDVIDAALKSVQKHGAGVEETVDVEAPPPESPEAKEIRELKAQLEFSTAKGREMMEKIRDSHEKMLRAAADLENFKKRAQKEKEEVQRFGTEKLLKDFLPVLDNLDRAFEHSRTGAEGDGFRQGVAMTRKMFEDTLTRNGVKAFSAKGKPFDPNLHEAMQQVETDELPPNHVYAELVRGFTLNDRLIRPALVMVTKAKPPAEPTPAPTDSPVTSSPDTTDKDKSSQS